MMYEIVTAQRSFVDQEHDTYLIIDIRNGLRPKVPDFMLKWIPEWYLYLMYRCWSDDPSERPTAAELSNLFFDLTGILYDNIVVMLWNNLKLLMKLKNTSKKLFELFSYSNKLCTSTIMLYWPIDLYSSWIARFIGRNM
ncbi:hypothetical protein Glove_84g40 [Diversispora epigaea]|uniref:Serine-threonine/tyrosine-protein kinase catalytic domain-containing protein n=1 Tax=Diversispora epigaea TaxID=1348612 RepID=A0A397J9T9_9GLOM|nr:hypothetical protein Glove_84g40 [Diversispora epigaea]